MNIITIENAYVGQRVKIVSAFPALFDGLVGSIVSKHPSPFVDYVKVRPDAGQKDKRGSDIRQNCAPWNVFFDGYDILEEE